MYVLKVPQPQTSIIVSCMGHGNMVALNNKGYQGQTPFSLTFRCSTNITWDYCSKGTCENHCETNKTTGLPTDGCTFLIHQHTTAKESVMAYPSLFSVSWKITLPTIHICLFSFIIKLKCKSTVLQPLRI